MQRGNSMAHEDEGHYAAKHPPETKLNQKIADAVRIEIKDGKISCAAAHKISMQLRVTPAEVGVTIDLLEARISRCQLGLYGYGRKKRIVEAADEVSQGLEDAIRGALQEGRLPCAASWEIAETSGIPKMNVSAACEQLAIKITRCQLGSF